MATNPTQDAQAIVDATTEMYDTVGAQHARAANLARRRSDRMVQYSLQTTERALRHALAEIGEAKREAQRWLAEQRQRGVN